MNMMWGRAAAWLFLLGFLLFCILFLLGIVGLPT
jgi:hypothetical protein